VYEGVCECACVYVLGCLEYLVFKCMADAAAHAGNYVCVFLCMCVCLCEDACVCSYLCAYLHVCEGVYVC